MFRRSSIALSLGFLLALGLSASEAFAQGRGSAARGAGGQGDTRSWEDGRIPADEERGPRFCRSGGQGHPVFGMRWCEEKGFGHGWPRGDLYENRRRDSRDGDYPVRDSYERTHVEFHRHLDRKYGELAARRPLDVQYQVRLRMEKATEHDRWHERAGVRH